MKKADKKNNKYSFTVLELLKTKGFELTAREKRLLQELFDWQEQSAKTHWILGQPLYG